MATPAKVHLLHSTDKRAIWKYLKDAKPGSFEVELIRGESKHPAVNGQLEGTRIMKFLRRKLPSVATWAENKGLWVWKNDVCVGFWIVRSERQIPANLEFNVELVHQDMQELRKTLLKVYFDNNEMLKIRTMKIGSNHTAETHHGEKFTGADDRITWLAKKLKLRKWKDEIPQLFQALAHPFKQKILLTGPRAILWTDVTHGKIQTKELILMAIIGKPGVANCNYYWECKNVNDALRNLERFVAEHPEDNIIQQFNSGRRILRNVKLGIAINA